MAAKVNLFAHFICSSTEPRCQEGRIIDVNYMNKKHNFALDIVGIFWLVVR